MKQPYLTGLNIWVEKNMFLEVIFFFLSDIYGHTIYDTVSTKQYLEYSFCESCFSLADMGVYAF